RASFHLHGRRVSAFTGADGRTEEHLLAVRQRDLARVRPWSAVACAPPSHGNAIARLHGDITLPAVSVEGADAVAFKLPVDDRAAFVGDVDVEVAMRICPLDLRDDAGHGHWSLCVVFSAKGVVRTHGRPAQGERSENDANVSVRRSHGSPRRDNLPDLLISRHCLKAARYSWSAGY